MFYIQIYITDIKNLIKYQLERVKFMEIDVKSKIEKAMENWQSRVRIEPLMNEKAIKSFIEIPDDVFEMIENIKQPRERKDTKYSYLKGLMDILGDTTIGNNKNIKKVYSSHTDSSMVKDASTDRICLYLNSCSNSEKDKIAKQIKEKGIHIVYNELIDSSEEFKDDSKYKIFRYMTLISILINSFKQSKIVYTLNNFKVNNLDNLFETSRISELLKSVQGPKYTQYIIGSLIDKFICKMSPKECTLFFQGLDKGLEPFENFKFSPDVIQILKKYQYRSLHSYKNEVLLRLKTFSKDDAKTEYARYATKELIEKYKEDDYIERIADSLKGNKVYIINEYYKAVSCARYLLLADNERLTKEALKQRYLIEIEKNPKLKGIISWTPCWNDFIDKVDIDKTSKLQFIRKVIREQYNTPMGTYRYCIVQSDRDIIGGITLIDTEDKSKIKVAVWTDVAMNKLSIAKEAIWLLCNILKESQTRYRILQFRVNKNNLYMHKLLNKIKAYKLENSLDSDNTEIYEVDIERICSMNIDNIRK